jgi:hypothetical protein
MNTATDDHRYIITAPWGDMAYADTPDQAIAARRQLARDGRDHHGVNCKLESVTIVDRGYAEAA